MADTAFDFLGDATIHASTGDAAKTQAKEEEDAFSAAVSVWRGNDTPCKMLCHRRRGTDTPLHSMNE